MISFINKTSRFKNENVLLVNFIDTAVIAAGAGKHSQNTFALGKALNGHKTGNAMRNQIKSIGSE